MVTPKILSAFLKYFKKSPGDGHDVLIGLGLFFIDLLNWGTSKFLSSTKCSSLTEILKGNEYIFYCSWMPSFKLQLLSATILYFIIFPHYCLISYSCFYKLRQIFGYLTNFFLVFSFYHHPN